MEKYTWMSFVLLLVVARRDISCQSLFTTDNTSINSIAIKYLLETLIKANDALSEQIKVLKHNYDGVKQRLDEQNDAIFDIMLKLQSSCKDPCVKSIAEMNETVDGLTQRINEQVEEISSIKSKQMAYEGDYVEMNGSVVSLRQQLAVQRVEISDLKLDLQSFEQDNVAIHKNTDALQERLNVHTNGLQDIKRQIVSSEQRYMGEIEEVKTKLKRFDNQQTVSFSARVSPSFKNIAPYTVITFSQVVTNIGNAYNSTTGEFIVPRPGVYVFYSNILSEGSKVIETILQVNGNTKLWLYSGGKPFHGAGSNMLVIHLESGDIVRMSTHCCGSRPLYIHHAWSTFSGFLLTPD